MSTYSFSKKTNQVTILSGASVSNVIETMDSSLLGFIMPAAWTTAGLSLEVSMDGTTFAPTIYDETNQQTGYWSSIVAGAAYSVSLTGMMAWRYIRFRSGTSASPGTQGADRIITAIMRPLA